MRRAPFGLLSQLSLPAKPWTNVSLPWIMNLPLSHYHDPILVVVNRLTKQVVFYPTTKSMAAADVAALFLQHVVRVQCSIGVNDRKP